MSWWWLAPLAVAVGGAAALRGLDYRAEASTRRIRRATADLRVTAEDLRAARHDLTVDVAGFATRLGAEPEPPGPPEKAAPPQ